LREVIVRLLSIVSWWGLDTRWVLACERILERAYAK
jgi:hypothetical protein